MSRLFDGMQGSRSAVPSRTVERNDLNQMLDTFKQSAVSSTAGGSRPDADVETFLDSVRESRAAATAVTAFRLQDCRKTCLPRSYELVLSGSQEPLAAEGYRSVRTRLVRMQLTQGVRTFVITSSLPGEGKTLSTMNLAVCCGQLQDYPVLVVDADLRICGLTKRLGSPAGRGLREVLAGQAAFEQAVVATDQPNVYAVAAGNNSLAPPELFASDRWKEFVRWCSETFKIVLIDTPPVAPLADFELIAAPCDSVIMVIRALQTSRETLKKTIAQIDKSKFGGLIFNGSESPRQQYYYKYYYSEKART